MRRVWIGVIGAGVAVLPGVAGGTAPGDGTDVDAVYSAVAVAESAEIIVNKADLVISPLVSGGPAHTRAEVSVGPSARGHAAFYQLPPGYHLGLALAGQEAPVATQADASYPGVPEQEAGTAATDLPGFGRVEGGHAAVRATGEPAVTSVATTGESRSVDGSVRIASSTSETSTRADGRRAEATATAEASGIDIAGVLRIESVRTVATIVAGDGAHPMETTTTVSGSSVNGVPVTITDAGVVVADQALPVDTVAQQEQVNDALATAGLTVRALNPTPNASGSVVLDLIPPTPGTTAPRSTVLLGYVSVAASHQAGAVEPSLDSSGGDLLGLGATSQPMTGSSPGSALNLASVPSLGSPAAPPALAATGGGGRLLASNASSNDHDMRPLFVVWLLSALGLLSLGARRARQELTAS